MRIATILVLVGYLLILTLELWRDAGAAVALLVAMTLSLLVMVAWCYVPLNDLRRFQSASVLGWAMSNSGTTSCI